MSFDPEAYRAGSSESWDKAAAGWSERREAIQRDAAAVSEWLVDAIDPRPGQTVLEVAAGLGDTGLLAAERVGAEGLVIVSDGVQSMVAAAKEYAEERAATNVEARQMEAEWLDQGTATVDGLLSRWGYMLLADPEAALREARRVLRPGGRIALAVWDPIEHNPWIGVLQTELLARGLATEPEPGVPGMFALAGPGRIEELLGNAGFSDISRSSVGFAFAAPSLDAWWEHMLTVSISLGDALAKLSPADHYALRDAVDKGYAPFTAPDGSVRLPASALVASAEA